MPFTMPNWPDNPGGTINAISGALSRAPETYMNLVKAKYAPMTIKADAMSKMAYANLMGPQFIAKLMGNPDILGGMTDSQRDAYTKMLMNSGLSQAQIAAMLGNNDSSPSIADRIKSALNLGGSGSNSSPAISQPQSSGQPDVQIVPEVGTGYTPEQAQEDNKPFSQRVAEYSKTKEQGKKTGELLAQDVSDLAKSYQEQQADIANLNLLGKTLSDPELENIRKFPVGGHQELSFYAATGNKRQKELIGNLRAGLKNSIVSGAQGLKGAFRQGEQTLLTSGYPSESDTIDVMKGKYEQTATLKKMIADRTKVMMNLEKNGIDQATASDIADKAVNGEAIRKQIQNSINRPVKIRNKKTGEEKTIPYSEINKWMQ